MLVALALVGGLAPGALADPSAAPTVSPLARSNYTVAPVCARPTLGARCLALELVPVSAAARERRHPIGMTVRARSATAAGAEACTENPITEGCYGLRPQDLQAAYSLATPSAATPQTVAIVAAFNDPTAVKDLKRYDETFGLPACNTHDKCLQQVNQKGEKELPKTEGWWAQEISIDIEATHAICQNCHILLVEAEEDTSAELEAAEDTAAADGANEISNSWVQPERLERQCRLQPPGGRDHGRERRRRLFELGARLAGSGAGRLPRLLAPRGGRRRDASGRSGREVDVLDLERLRHRTRKRRHRRRLQRTLRSPLLAARTPRLGERRL